MTGRALQGMSYDEWLSSPRFAEIRREAIARAGGRCQACNNSMGLEAHHRSYTTLGTPDEIDDVIVLCETCHELFSERIQVHAGAPAEGGATG